MIMNFLNIILLAWVACFIVNPVLCARGDFSAFQPAPSNPFTQTIENEKAEISAGGRMTIDVLLPANHEFTPGISLEYEIFLSVALEQTELSKGSVPNPRFQMPLEADIPSHITGDAILRAEIRVPYCVSGQSKMCKFKMVKLIQPLTVLKGNHVRERRIALNVE